MLFSSLSLPLSRIFAFILFVGLASGAARLPAQELESLSVAASTLGKTNWSFDGDDVNPCNEQPPWLIDKEKNAILCDCSYQNNTVCHVTSIDLTRNYLNGTIPQKWGSMQSLTTISLLGNRLTGPIPKELANITTLEELVLEANQFTESVPPEFGDFPRIRRLVLTSNNLSGVLPESLAKLTTLTEFRISGNNFTGRIPNYIQNWTNITRIDIQGSGLSGPIPPNLTSLTNLNELRISDLNGVHSSFPYLSIQSSWKNLILRSCNIVGEIPPFIVQIRLSNIMDLSFNKLTGKIPGNLVDLNGDLYLTGNSLNGTLPLDLMKNKGNVDLSYNNLNTSQISEPNCGEGSGSPNLFANSKGSTTFGNFYNCLTSSCKPNDYSFFHVNCGTAQKVDDYEADGGASSNFFRSPNSNWGYSSTGIFLNKDAYGVDRVYSLQNNSIWIPQIYREARLSPLSLTYFGFCLRNGNYTVKLYFAEIMFTNDTTFSSLGRRIFDVYIQGNLVKKDYNIANAAGGVYKPIVESFPAVVTDHTLEIRFYWAGKGTTVIPQRAVYGPLISAISVTNDNYKPSAAGKGLSTGAIVGIVMALLFGLIILVVGIILWCRKGHSMHHIDGTIIAVKQLSSKSKQGNREFVNEIGMISALQHPHLVKLYGCCIEGDQLLLVYEYMENNSLARALFGNIFVHA
ncbi:hypothetical protein C2S51_003748 [Perilla frutescens var. frutescens]|nr:hypothetical protein C2S51_003748 [Perilla frutescens var. frutescens]